MSDSTPQKRPPPSMPIVHAIKSKGRLTMNENAPSSQIIPLFSMETRLGTWRISCPSSNFDVTHITYNFPYHLTNSSYPDFSRISSNDVYPLIIAVAEHKTGLWEWDESRIAVSDYVLDWKYEFDDTLRMRVLGAYLIANPNDSMRQLVDYVHFKHGWLMDRLKIRELLEQLIMTGQIESLPSMSFAPAEMKSLIRLANVWLKD